MLIILPFKKVREEKYVLMDFFMLIILGFKSVEDESMFGSIIYLIFIFHLIFKIFV